MPQHSKWSPSARARWSVCAGSVAYLEALNPPEEVSEFASDGIVAHAEAAECLSNGKIHVDPQLMVYIDYLRELPGILAVEQELVHPAASELHGTADAVVYSYSGELTVCDLKWGQGQIVEAAQNKQLLMYLVLAARVYPEFHTARAVIIQPRAEGEPIKEWVVTPEEIDAEEARIFAEVEATKQPNAPLVSGRHCQWCRAAVHCPTRRENAQIAVGMKTAMPAPESLRPEQLDWMLRHRSEVESYFKKVGAFALSRAMTGDLPGWKAVTGQGNRRWKDEAEALKALKKLGLKLDEVAPRTLVSPAQAEAKGIDKKWTALMTVRPEGAARLVPDIAPGAAVNVIDVFNVEEG